jgi:putative transposase
MSDYRRWYVPGGTYFFTVVTYQRCPILCSEVSRKCLREAIEIVRKKRPFKIVAIALLPDHLHIMLTLPQGDADYSTRWKRIKEEYTRLFFASGGKEQPISHSRLLHGERGVWQRRFWEHTVRDEEDLNRCVDYVHWNPNKHGHVSNIRDWQWSSFQRYVKLGEYTIDWGANDPAPDFNAPEWGE